MDQSGEPDNNIGRTSDKEVLPMLIPNRSQLPLPILDILFPFLYSYKSCENRLRREPNKGYFCYFTEKLTDLI